MHVDKKSPIPVYYQLKNIILDKIKRGEYPAESLIPSERELGETLGISRMTVRQALNQLVAEGILYREKGKGTFVSKMKFEQRNIMSFSDMVRKKGLTPTTRILHFCKIPANPNISEFLELNIDDMVFHIRRLRLADNTPVGIEENFIPEKFCPELDRFDLTSSLYSIIKEEYNHAISYVDSIIEAAKPAKEEKELLAIPDSIPVLRITTVNYTESGLKLLYERSAYRSDEYKYNVRVYGDRNIE